MTPQDFKLRFDNYRKAMEQRNGTTITPDQAVEQGVDRQILQELALQESIAAAIHDKLGGVCKLRDLAFDSFGKQMRDGARQEKENEQNSDRQPYPFGNAGFRPQAPLRDPIARI